MDLITYLDIAWESLTDGPGTRTVVYLRGCDLRCPWCHSPHSWERKAPLLFFEDRCTLCGTCVEVCPEGVHRVEDGVHTLDRTQCKACDACIDHCPTVLSRERMGGALARPGHRVSVDQLFGRLRPQLTLLEPIGGLTVSGGEPLRQAAPVRSLLEKCRGSGFHTAVETSASVPLEAFEQLADVVDCWLVGLRPVDGEQQHVSAVARLPRVKENLEFLAGLDRDKIIIRTPVVPGFTDGADGLADVAQTMLSLGLQRLELLPYNPCAALYYRAMGLHYPLAATQTPTDATVQAIARSFLAKGIQVRVVG